MRLSLFAAGCCSATGGGGVCGAEAALGLFPLSDCLLVMH